MINPLRYLSWEIFFKKLGYKKSDGYFYYWGISVGYTIQNDEAMVIFRLPGLRHPAIHVKKGKRVEELCTVLEVITDPHKAPLLAGISWAAEIMAYLLETSDEG